MTSLVVGAVVAAIEGVALLAYFEVLTNIFWATLLLNEGISARITFGGALILIAAILMRPAKTPV